MEALEKESSPALAEESSQKMNRLEKCSIKQRESSERPVRNIPSYIWVFCTIRIPL